MYEVIILNCTDSDVYEQKICFKGTLAECESYYKSLMESGYYGAFIQRVEL